MSRILIAEDEPRISAFVEKGLTANGFAVTVVADGLSAFDHALTGGFDLVPDPGDRATCPSRAGSRSFSPGCGCGWPPTAPPS